VPRVESREDIFDVAHSLYGKGYNPAIFRLQESKMPQCLSVDLPKDDLASLVNVARQIVAAPGVPVSVPREVVLRVECVLQQTLTATLTQVRDRERSVPSETLELRFR
jgi:hypothetical protein